MMYNNFKKNTYKILMQESLQIIFKIYENNF